ncbi:hypothetical protein [Bordetella bronchiseptica]|uniref:hypothetical protein n=1 Tax=Bordetella bronchiseptica TaxID=518 RepID=UPI0004617B5B|nr:hypothetical protein [Bordetella bronchiseptica]KDD09863.1 hypothetical protein L522_1762 [Bordetella bronchiseptica MBORD707]
MTTHHNAAQAANENPLSDEYVNAIIQRHGYDSLESVIAQLHQWIGLHGGEDTVTLLMYEAHKALSKLRPPAPAMQEAVLTDAEIREIQGTHLVTVRSRDALIASVIVAGRAIEAAVLSKLRAPVADERAVLADLLDYVDSNTCIHESTHRGGAIWTICDGCGAKWADDEGGFVPHQDAPAVAAARTALASAPVSKPKRAPLDDWRVQAIAECLEAEWDYTTADQAEADARLIVGYLIEYEKESDRIEAQHAAEPVHPIVQAVRNLRASAPVADTFQARVQPWMMDCFGPEISADRQERNHRFIEEALELVQACGATASEAHQLVDYVFGRPIGEPAQEVGGVMVTLAALCLANGQDMHEAGDAELARISAPAIRDKIRAKQAGKPKHSPLPQSAPVADERQALRRALDGMLAVFACGAPAGESPTIDAARAALAAPSQEPKP